MRLVKSREELDWLKIGCAFVDLAVEALEREVRPGLDEHDLGDIIERAYVPWGGQTNIHYTGVTSMSAPSCPVPWQVPRNRKVQTGDVVFTEIAASFWSYPGQIQRTIAVGAKPTQLYADLHAAGEDAFNAIFNVLAPGVHVEAVLDAASCIEKAGFTICDDLVHGYVGGYLPPVLGTRERPSSKVPDFTFKENMTVVIQPSVMTRDEKAGIQTGELVHITASGAQRIHEAPKGFRIAAD
jgi:Xaa-Pro aminopeptidase